MRKGKVMFYICFGKSATKEVNWKSNMKTGIYNFVRALLKSGSHQSSPSGVETKNGWAYTFTAPVYINSAGI